MQAYESIRYNDGKGTVKSKSYSVYGTDGQLLRQTPYSFTYGDPSKGEIPDALYKFETSGGSYSYAYDRLARLESRTLTVGNTVKTESYTYAANPANSAFTTPLVSSMTDLAGKTHTYTYDANGNILTDTYDGNTVSYEYDSLNRMTRYNDPVFGRTYVYVYDDRGNITEMQDHSYTTGALSAYYSSCEYEYGDSTWADLMTSYWGEDIAYDELGNPLNWIWGDTLTWQNGRQLASVGGVTYGYNADGLRVSKTWARGSTEYYIVDGQYIGEKSVRNGTQYFITYTYDENGAPAGINVNGTQYWFVKNLQGDVTAILDSSGAVVANYRYDAYGYIISITNGSGANVGLTDSGHIARLNPFRYRGYMYDEETGYYYLRSRYYNPEMGRFLNADGLVSTGQGLDGNNMFAYCNSNPIGYIDNNGTHRVCALEKTRALGMSTDTIAFTEAYQQEIKELKKEKLKNSPNSLSLKDDLTSTYLFESHESIIARMLYGEDPNAIEGHLWLLENRLQEGNYGGDTYVELVLADNQFDCMRYNRSLDPASNLGNPFEKMAWDRCVDMAYQFFDEGIESIQFEYKNVKFTYSYSLNGGVDIISMYPNGFRQGGTWFYYK